jgi:hypothetical protein
MKKVFLTTVLTFIIIIIVAEDILSIPAFARKYNTTCKTCHSPFPVLKDYGDEFAGNGFQLKDKDAPRYYVETGDEKLSLLRDFPLAVRLEGYVTYNQGNVEQSDFTTPLIFKLLTGGAIAKDISYYVYYILENSENGKIEDAWFMLNNLFGTGLDFTIGQFQVSDPLFKRELRLTRDDYYIYKVKPGASNVDLTYDRGIMIGYGFDTGTDIVVEVLNGSGIGEGFSSGNFDNDKYKNLFGRISQDAGEHLRIGAMGYWGKEEQGSPEGAFHKTNELWMLGGDATVTIQNLELNLQFVQRRDDNPEFTMHKERVETKGAFAELIFRPKGDESNWYSILLFNWIESDQTDLNLKQLGFSLGYLLRRNVRLVAEYSHNFTAEYGKVGLGFVTAF